VQSAVNEAIKSELSRSNVVTDEVIKYIKSLTEPGGDLLKTIEHLMNSGSAASDVKIANGMNEIANVKTRVMAIESAIGSQNNPVSGFSGGSHKGRCC
jgi:hypothetical protein